MVRLFKNIFIVSFGLAFAHTAAYAQTNDWPSPEVAQMYQQARNYLSVGDVKQAIVVYQQAIQLAPGKMELYRDLGKAYYLSGDYKAAQNTLAPLLKSPEADDQSYQTMASCMSAAGDAKKAKKTLSDGIERFPQSGLLYHDLGKLYDDDNKPADALNTWLKGIKQAPEYHVNYYEAARTYMNTDDFIWTIIYGEIFLTIEHHTQRSDEMRRTVMEAYKKLFFTSPQEDVPTFGSVPSAHTDNFADAVRSTLMKLSPVVLDGITTENLTMLRTRFVIDWMQQYNSRYPFALFNYQDKMIRDGYFDAYNEWLWGKIENPQWYDAWNKFHAGAMDQFETWMKQNPFHPLASEYYNNTDAARLFAKKKK